MWRDRGEISLDLCGFPGGKIRRQGIYTFIPENAVLLRNNPISAPMKNRGAVATEKLPRPGSFFVFLSTLCLSFPFCLFLCL